MKRLFKITVFLMISVFILASFSACKRGDGGSFVSQHTDDNTDDQTSDTTAEKDDGLKAGLICYGDESSVYDRNFISSFRQACNAESLSEGNGFFIKTGISDEDFNNAADSLVSSGCDVILCDFSGYEDMMIKKARQYPDKEFCLIGGTKAHTEGLSNYHNAYAEIYYGRFLAGVAAGLKLKDMIESGAISESEAVMGYVGAFTYPEVISGYTAFYLGAKYICPAVKMKVCFTGSWFDEALEREAADQLIDDGCVLISEHSGSMGVPKACEAAGVYNISYDSFDMSSFSNSYIISCRIEWEPYFAYVLDSLLKNKSMDADWVGNADDGSIMFGEINEKTAAAGTGTQIDAVSGLLKSGKLHVFDIESFTVNERKIKYYQADVDTDENFEGDTEAIADGYFHESEFRSAPYFDLQIDGITLYNTAF